MYYKLLTKDDKIRKFFGKDEKHMSNNKDFFNFEDFEAKDFLKDTDECHEEKYEEEEYVQYGNSYCFEKKHDDCKQKYNCYEEKHDDCEPKHDCYEENYYCHDEKKHECKKDYDCHGNNKQHCGNPCWDWDDDYEECHKEAKLEIHKSVDKCVAMKGDVLRYSIIVKNCGNTDACNVVIKDCLSKSAKYVPGSLEINGKCIETCRELDELVLGNLCPGKEIKICFSAKIVGECDEVENFAVACFWYRPHRCAKPCKGYAKSNVVKTNILQPRVIIEKCVDKEVVKVGEELCYKIIVKNCGKCTAENFVLKDVLDCSLKCLHVIVKHGCHEKPVCCEDLACGLKLGDIPCGETVEVFIKAKVICPPVGCFVRNRATGVYEIHCAKLHAEGSNEVKTKVILNSCRTEIFEDCIKLPCNKGPVCVICKKYADVKLIDVKCVNETKDARIYKIKVATKVCFEYKKECGQLDCICKECIWEKDICLPKCYKYGENFIITVCEDGLEAKIKCGFDILYKLGIEVCIKNCC